MDTKKETSKDIQNKTNKDTQTKTHQDIQKETRNAKIDTPVFSTLVHSITHSALANMGLIPDIKQPKNKNLAAFNIDLLVLLKQKTKGNLTTEETQLLNHCVQDLQLTFAKQMSTPKG